jgi:hypothetical protein
MFSELTDDLLDLQSKEMGTDPLLACISPEVNIGTAGIEICVVLASCGGCCSSRNLLV